MRAGGDPSGALGLRAVVLLAGTIRPTELSRGIGRSILDLPVSGGKTILGHWGEMGASLGAASALRPLPVRVMVDAMSPLPRSIPETGSLAMKVERDPRDYRGTAGILRDISAGYADADVLLVGNANQVMLEPLEGIARELMGTGADAAVLAHDGGTPVGMMLVRVRVLREVQVEGYRDFKEQWLPEVAKRHRVMVVRRGEPTGFPVRTLEGYVDALEHVHRPRGEARREDWVATFGIVEDGAVVASSARVHDSVVLSGARVGERAVVVRSVVGAGAVVAPGAVVVDEVVAGPEGRASA